MAGGLNLFDVLGPVMIGPSSSHTAGAARAGRVARMLLGEQPLRAHIRLCGSFAKTGKGHGTDRAIVGGILGYLPDDVRIRDSFAHAQASGLSYSFSLEEESHYHPNTAIITLSGKDREVTAAIASVGGGAICVKEIDGAAVDFSTDYNTTVVFNLDRLGTVAAVTQLFADGGVNIAFLRLFRSGAGGQAIMVLESDQALENCMLDRLRELPNVERVIFIGARGPSAGNGESNGTVCD